METNFFVAQHSDYPTNELVILMNECQLIFLILLLNFSPRLISNESDRNQFNKLVLSLTNVLPDDDRAISVFDYFVDESGEWDTWETKLQETVLEEAVDAFGNIYVDNIISVGYVEMFCHEFRFHDSSLIHLVSLNMRIFIS